MELIIEEATEDTEFTEDAMSSIDLSWWRSREEDP